MKVLWVGDAVILSGFGTVTHNICSSLVNKCDLVVYGVGYDGKIPHQYPYRTYPGMSGQDLYTFDFFRDVVTREDPDVIVLFNDVPIINRFLDSLPANIRATCVPMFPVNYLPLETNLLLDFYVKGVTHVITYTEFSKQEVQKINPNFQISAVYHGVDNSAFHRTEDVKKSTGLEGTFVVGCTNTNTYRKRFDLLLTGFAKFAKGKDNARCLLHYNNPDVAYNIRSIAEELGISNKLLLSNSRLRLDMLNQVYNIMDVNVNTAMGEGFGLTLAEGAACCVPVLCPDIGNLRDIWGDAANYIAIDRQEYLPGTNYKGDVISTDDLADKLESIYTNPQEWGIRAWTRISDPRFDWNTVSEKVFSAVTSSTSNKICHIS